MELIELNNIYKNYHLGDMDVPVLKGVSLTVSRGNGSLSWAPRDRGKAP